MVLNKQSGGEMYNKPALFIIALLLSLALACEISFQQKDENEPNLDATRIALQEEDGETSTNTDLNSSCDAISNIKDVNYPDGSSVKPGETFTKTWSMKNTGTCTWSNNYRIALISAMDYSVIEWYPINQTVLPGSTAEISVPIHAPNREGVETFYYMLVNESGQVFGFGEQSEKPFWVNFKMEGDSQAAEDISDIETDENVEEKPCLLLGKVKDITIPDGTTMQPDENGMKTWELQNSGTCEWDSNFRIIRIGGEFMTMIESQPIGKVVKPGGTVQVSIPVFAPLESGTYFSYWQMQSSSGQVFGGGEDADASFWFKINVPNPEIEPLPAEIDPLPPEPQVIVDFGMEKMNWIGISKCPVKNSDKSVPFSIIVKDFNGHIFADKFAIGTQTYPTQKDIECSIYSLSGFDVTAHQTIQTFMDIYPSDNFICDFRYIVEGDIIVKVYEGYPDEDETRTGYKLLGEFSIPFEHTCLK